MNNSLFEDMRETIEPVMALVDEAALYLEPEINAIISNRIVDNYQVDKMLDSTLNYAGMSERADRLFRRLCNHYYFVNPNLVSEWIVIYRDMYGEDNHTEKGINWDDLDCDEKDRDDIDVISL